MPEEKDDFVPEGDASQPSSSPSLEDRVSRLEVLVHALIGGADKANAMHADYTTASEPLDPPDSPDQEDVEDEEGDVNG